MNLLLLTDRQELHSSLEKHFKPQGFTVFTLSKKNDFYSFIREREIKIIILDLTEDKIQDFALLRSIKNFDPLIDVIIIGAQVPASTIVESIKLGATDYLVKPLDIKMLQAVFYKIKQKSQLHRETYQLERKLVDKYIFQGMVGKNPHMLEVFSLIERVAKHSVSVLITGETGTGKEMVARAIHNLSPRHSRKFIVCDCTAIPETLFESELFGYLKGAFTGADKHKDGLFKEADGGTIFLDEIGEIPVSIQSKLLRVLEEHQFRPLGSNKNVHVDVRVISATSRHLKDNIQKGFFREDLYHRINIFEIDLLPLRKRREDIPLLSRYFLNKYNRKFNKRIRGISQRAQKILLEYPWSGNVRELEHIIERAVMLCQETFLDIKDFKDNITEHIPEDVNYDPASLSPILSLAEVEKKHLLKVLKITNNNKQKAARLLGLSRQALYRKLKKHSLPI